MIPECQSELVYATFGRLQENELEELVETWLANTMQIYKGMNPPLHLHPGDGLITIERGDLFDKASLFYFRRVCANI